MTFIPLDLSKNRETGFSLVEVLAVVLTIAIIAVAAFVMINPFQRINAGDDSSRREEVQTVLSAVLLYAKGNQGNLPTYNSGTALPQVTSANVMDEGVPASQIDKLIPTYTTSIPIGPQNDEYKVGRLSNGQVVVATILSDGSLYTVSQ